MPQPLKGRLFLLLLFFAKRHELAAIGQHVNRVVHDQWRRSDPITIRPHSGLQSAVTNINPVNVAVEIAND